jgi:hypothetical protein
MGVGGQPHAPATLHLGTRPSTKHTGGWMGLRSNVDGYRKLQLHEDANPRPSHYTDYTILSTDIVSYWDYIV